MKRGFLINSLSRMLTVYSSSDLVQVCLRCFRSNNPKQRNRSLVPTLAVSAGFRSVRISENNIIQVLVLHFFLCRQMTAQTSAWLILLTLTQKRDRLTPVLVLWHSLAKYNKYIYFLKKAKQTKKKTKQKVTHTVHRAVEVSNIQDVWLSYQQLNTPQGKLFLSHSKHNPTQN